MNKYNLSVLIVNLNTAKFLYQCLTSIYGNTYTEIIVVDNASQDDSVKIVKNNFPTVKLIENDKNVGFSVANNQGLSESSGEYILLLNSDTIVKDQAIEKMMNFLENNPNAGAIGPKLLSKDNEIQRSFFRFPSLICEMFYRYPFKEFKISKNYSISYHDWQTLKIKEVDWISGACLMLKRKVINKIGFLDPDYFLYFEDVDICLRIKKAGYKVYYYPEAEVIHIGQRSSRTEFSFIISEWQKSRLLYFKKHHSLFSYLVICCIAKMGNTLRRLGLK